MKQDRRTCSFCGNVLTSQDIMEDLKYCSESCRIADDGVDESNDMLSIHAVEDDLSDDEEDDDDEEHQDGED